MPVPSRQGQSQLHQQPESECKGRIILIPTPLSILLFLFLFFIDTPSRPGIRRGQFFDTLFMKRGRKSVKNGCGRATVTGYETSMTTLS